CWFEGKDPTEEFAEEFSEAVAGQPQASFTSSRGVIVDDVKEGKRVVRFFISYGHENATLKEDLLKRLGSYLKTAKNYEVQLWDDGEILPGDRWREEIEKNINRSHFGLLLVSPEFLCSEYITKNELPAFIQKAPDQPGVNKRAIPVGLKPILFDGSMDLKGLEEHQVYINRGKFYSELNSRQRKDEFVKHLFQTIIKVLDKRFSQELAPDEKAGGVEEEQFVRYSEDFFPKKLREKFVNPIAVKTVQDKLNITDIESEYQDKPHDDALDILLKWAKDPEGQKLFILLGEYGIGKTTLMRAFTHKLLEERKNNRQYPLPIYFDLRLLGKEARTKPKLETILADLIEKSWRYEQKRITPKEIIRLVRQEGAIVIFDGLDEVLVYLDPQEGRQFIRALWSIILIHQAQARNGKMGRVIMTTRSHYFRTVREQITYFTGEDREDIRTRDYLVLVLLPFSEEQIREYLQRSFPGEDVDRIMELIRSVHNLPDLAKRPYTLNLITENIWKIETWKLRGVKVTGARFYEHVINSWLERDDPKHQILPQHKRLLMEHLAAELWRSQQRTWSVNDLEQWLVDFLDQHKQILKHYTLMQGASASFAAPLERFKEDLRTATFLVREGNDQFRFAHTSVQEFFLASYLARSLKEYQPQCWNLPRPSAETLDFLGQLLEQFPEKQRKQTLNTMQKIKSNYISGISENLLHYLILANEKNYPRITFARFNLTGARLKELRISRKGDIRPDFSGTKFQGADLRNARFDGLVLRRANFTGADLQTTQFLNCTIDDSNFSKANLVGTLFRKSSLRKTIFHRAKFYRTQLIYCDMNQAIGLPNNPDKGLYASCSGLAFSPPCPEKKSLFLKAFIGHTDSVRSVTFSPDGTRLVSSGEDGMVCLWDASTGEGLETFNGHEGSIHSVEFSPDGSRLASGGTDGIVRLWDAATGEELKIFKGHLDSVYSVVFSPDGIRLASGGEDSTVRLWDITTGEELGLFKGHKGSVRSVVFSPDGTQLASGGEDGTLRLWDIATGEELKIFKGHLDSVYSVAFSADGNRLASGGFDGILRLWDATTGEMLGVFKGHKAWIWSVAFSPDGTRLASGGFDGTVRLWSAVTSEMLVLFKGHKVWIWSMTFSPDGTRLVSGGDENTLRVWDAATGEALGVFKGHDGSVWSVAFSPNGTRLASGDSGGTIRLWDMEKGKMLRIFKKHKAFILSIAFNPDGTKLASGGFDGTVILWDMTTGEVLEIFKRHNGWVRSIAFNLDGTQLASGGFDGIVRLWDTTTGKELGTFKRHEDRVMSVAFSPEDTRLVSGGSDGTLRLWDSATGKELGIFKGHKTSVLSVAFSPDGNRLASGGSDRTVRMWDTETGKLLGIFKGHKAPVLSVAFSPDGLHLASGGSDGTVRLWDFRTKKEIWAVHQFPHSAYAVIANKQLTFASPDAWRWLGYLEINTAERLIRRWPVEIYKHEGIIFE
ncbi:MAG TPA: NACHT domain-containing protein, partial [Bacteroidetes bacterium]|nr:NACHT domain-containing protein [Bacteroidota bacterium]